MCSLRVWARCGSAQLEVRWLFAEAMVSSACMIYIPSRLMSSCAAASTAPITELAWADSAPSWKHIIGWAVSDPLPPPSSSAAVDSRVGGAVQRGGQACMQWLAPASAISGGDGVDGISGGSHSSQKP